MFQQFVRLTLAATIWRKYRQYIVGVLCLIGFWVLVSFIHQDYLAFAQLDAAKSQTVIAYSYGLKWLLFILSGMAFTLYVRKPMSSKGNKSLQSMLSSDRKVGPTTATNAREGRSSTTSDPFENIRTKTKLRSKADMVLEQAKQDRK